VLQFRLVKLAGALIGMVHLAPLPGSPLWAGSLAGVIDRALADARALVDNGFDALLIENFGDVPFAPGRVEAATVAAMAVAADRVRRATAPRPLGVNVLRSDARSALAIAAAAGASFVRVNVHAAAVVADQGIIESDAYHTLRDRRLLGVDARIFADVRSKHASPLGAADLEQQARDLVHRGLADGLIVSGHATGEATALGDLKRVRGAVPGTPVIVGSGATAETAAELLSVADALVVGTWLKEDGDVRNPIDPARVRRFVHAARG
jgi:uncharacterized protein